MSLNEWLNGKYECQVCKEKDARIADLEQRLFHERTEKTRLLDVIVNQVTPAKTLVSENNENLEQAPVIKKMTWPQRKRMLEEQDRIKAEELRAEAAARKQMQDLIDESKSENKDASNIPETV